MPLNVKEVWVDDRRYIVRLNEKQARKDEQDRTLIISRSWRKARNPWSEIGGFFVTVKD